MKRFLFSMLLFALTFGLPWGQKATGQAVPAQEWTAGFIDSLAIGWPDNCVENVPVDVQWSPDAPERLTIVQLGDSHVQADYSARATRVHLAHRFGIDYLPRGYTFPFAAARSNEPPDVRSRGWRSWNPVVATKNKKPQPLGLAPVALDATTSNAQIHLQLDPARGPSALPSTVQVLFVPQEPMAIPLLNGTAPDSIDSFRGSAFYHFSAPTDRLELTIQNDSANSHAFRLVGFILDNETSPIVYHAAGLNGADVNTHLQNTFLQTELQLVNPKIVVISLGTNDAYSLSFTPERFATTLRTLIAQVREACPQTLIILMTPADHLFRRDTVNPRVAEAAEVIRNLAIEEETALWDLHRIMGGPGSIYSWYNQGLVANDMLHFSPKGYELQGKLLGEALFKMLAKKKS